MKYGSTETEIDITKIILSFQFLIKLTWWFCMFLEI